MTRDGDADRIDLGKGGPEPKPEPFVMCETCALRKHCWRTDLKPDQIAINLLTCRLQTRSGFDEAASQLLPEILPGIARGVETAKRYFPIRESADDLIQEAQAPLIESLITRFRFSKRMHPLRWLFGSKAKVRLTGVPQGALALWLRTRLRKEAGRPDKERDGHDSMYGHLPEDAHSAEAESIDAEAQRASIATYERLVDRLQVDGHYLESRVIARGLAYLKFLYRQPFKPDRAMLDACSDLGTKRAKIQEAVTQHADIWQDFKDQYGNEKEDDEVAKEVDQGEGATSGESARSGGSPRTGRGKVACRCEKPKCGCRGTPERRCGRDRCRHGRGRNLLQ